ncbi:hypothetical protein [Streptomyces sp. H27-C3]|uniref:hypothetical protein n=1 Tax=Streptomyces sp. H27-C3 TaxID=3046305 RepID=UPI0024B8EF7E|nr:hypothetical protein [Streptomyces sp. H27-C3]MDJ0466425.1 hypothetical protein [Streptomyces sp. H27-C3]
MSTKRRELGTGPRPVSRDHEQLFPQGRTVAERAGDASPGGVETSRAHSAEHPEGRRPLGTGGTE